MRQVALSYGIAAPDLSQHADDVFSDLIDGLSCLGKVVVLVDEYDKVLSDNVFSPEVEELRQVVDVVMLLCGKAVRVVAEDQTSEGRIDLSVVAGEHVYVMEYKVDKSAETALRQIKEKRYADKFRLEKGKTIHLLGIAFSSTGHTVQDWKEEVLD